MLDNLTKFSFLFFFFLVLFFTCRKEFTAAPSVRCQSTVWKCDWQFLSPEQEAELTMETTSMITEELQQNNSAHQSRMCCEQDRKGNICGHMLQSRMLQKMNDAIANTHQQRLVRWPEGWKTMKHYSMMNTSLQEPCFVDYRLNGISEIKRHRILQTWVHGLAKSHSYFLWTVG